MSSATARLLADGRRLHLQHGPIDIIAAVFAEPDIVARAYAQAAERFATVLSELVAERALLATPVDPGRPVVAGAIARRMVRAARPHWPVFVTPMAAVAGAVADTVLGAMVDGLSIDRAYANNGGDIALHLATGERLTSGIIERADRPRLDAKLEIAAADPVRGLATSGWRGRSLSFGIADAVTVLSADAASADIAATLIANAVDIDHPAVARAPATEIRDDTDLGDRLVTVAVGRLPAAAVDKALRRGLAAADAMRRRGLIVAAYLVLQDRTRVVSPAMPIEPTRLELEERLKDATRVRLLAGRPGAWIGQQSGCFAPPSKEAYSRDADTK